MLQQVTDDEHSNVNDRAVAFAKAMVAIGINHVVEWFAKFDKPVDEAFDNLNVRIRFARAGDDQQFALQTVRKIDRGRSFVSFGVYFTRSHEYFLKPCVV